MPRPAKLEIVHAASLDEIAAELGISRQRTAQILSRAMAKLRAELERRGWQAGDVEVERGDSPAATMEREGSTRI